MKVAVGITYIGCANCCGLFMSKDGFKGHIELCDGDPLKSPCEAFACARQKYLEFIAKESMLELKNNLDNCAESGVEKIISPRKNKYQRKRDSKKIMSKSGLAILKESNTKETELSQQVTFISDTSESTNNLSRNETQDNSIQRYESISNQTEDESFNLSLSSDEDENKSKMSIPLKSKMIKDVQMNLISCNSQIMQKNANKGLLTTTLDPPLSSCCSGNLLNEQQLSPGGWTHCLHGPVSMSKDALHYSNSVPSLETYGVPVSEAILQQDLTVNEMNVHSVESDKKSEQNHLNENESLLMQEDNFTSSHPVKHFSSEYDQVEEQKDCNREEASLRKEKFSYDFCNKTTGESDLQNISDNFVENSDNIVNSNTGDIKKLISQLEHSIKSNSGSDLSSELISAYKSQGFFNAKSSIPEKDRFSGVNMCEGVSNGTQETTSSSSDELVIDESPKIIRYKNKSRKRRKQLVKTGPEPPPTEEEQKNTDSQVSDTTPKEKSNYEAYFDFCGSQKVILEKQKPNSCLFLKEISTSSEKEQTGEVNCPKRSMCHVETVLVYPPGTPIITLNQVVDSPPPQCIPSDLQHPPPEEKTENHVSVQTDMIADDASNCSQSASHTPEEEIVPGEELEKLDISELVDKLAPTPRYKNGLTSATRSKIPGSKMKSLCIEKLISKSIKDRSDMMYCETEINGLPVLKRIAKEKKDEINEEIQKDPPVNDKEQNAVNESVEEPLSSSGMNPDSNEGASIRNEQTPVLDTCSNLRRSSRTLKRKKSDAQFEYPEPCQKRDLSEKRKSSIVPPMIQKYDGKKMKSTQGSDSKPAKDEKKLHVKMPEPHQYTILKESNKTIYKCNICKQNLLSLVKLRNHLSITHNDGGEFVCEHCSFKTFYRRRWKAHIKRHTKEKFICPYCPTFYIDNSSLNRHINFKHFEQSNYRCNECGYVAMNNPLLADHMRTHTGELLVCSYKDCDFKTPSIRKHRDHERSHTPNFVCVTCGYSTSLKQNFNHHLETHQTERTFQCSLCPYKARKKQRILRHAATVHFDVQTFACDRCSFTSSYRAALTCHIHSHEGIQPFKCSLCDYHSTSTSMIYRHARSLHPKSSVSAIKVLAELPPIKSSDYLNPNLKHFDPNLFEVFEIQTSDSHVEVEPEYTEVNKDS